MMTDHEAQVAWRLFTLNWIPLGLMGLTLALCLALTGFSIKPGSLLLPIGASALMGGVAHAYQRVRRRDTVVPFVLNSTMQLILISMLTPPLTYIAAAVSLPMQDANLAYLDRVLGLDWQRYYNFIYDRPALIPYIIFAYAMIVWPMFGIPIALGVARQYRRLQLFTLACALSLIVTIVFSAFVPAFGVYNGLSIKIDPAVFASSAYLSSLHDMPLIRDGTLRQLDISQLAGIVTFPSFHACAAVLFMWALWGVWWMRPLALIANAGMVLATPMAGGHYFVDVFAGMAVAVLAIAAAKRLGARLTQGASAPVAAMSMPEAAVPAE
jgi:hypothetical protein